MPVPGVGEQARPSEGFPVQYKTLTEKPLPARHCARVGQKNKQNRASALKEIPDSRHANKRLVHNVMSVIVGVYGKKKRKKKRLKGQQMTEE